MREVSPNPPSPTNRRFYPKGLPRYRLAWSPCAAGLRPPCCVALNLNTSMTAHIYQNNKIPGSRLKFVSGNALKVRTRKRKVGGWSRPIRSFILLRSNKSITRKRRRVN